jgi:diacylglycerol kinase family enzyme
MLAYDGAMPRVVLIVNPYSSGVSRPRLAAVADALERKADVQIRQTEAPGHATELAEAAVGNADAVVVFSGDGTYNEAINGAAGELPFGFVPGGGASVFPRALGLPRNQVAAARQIVDALVAGRSRSIALGRVNGRRFGFSAGVGLDAEAVRRMDLRGRSDNGKRPGDLTFAWTVTKMFAERRLSFEEELEIADHGRAAFLLVANCDPYTYAGAVPLHLLPEARFELGLDFVAPSSVRARSLPRLATRALAGKLPDAPDVLSGHDLDRFEARCDRPLPLQADGEDLGDVEHVVFEAERNAVTVLA